MMWMPSVLSLDFHIWLKHIFHSCFTTLAKKPINWTSNVQLMQISQVELYTLINMKMDHGRRTSIVHSLYMHNFLTIVIISYIWFYTDPNVGIPRGFYTNSNELNRWIKILQNWAYKIVKIEVMNQGDKENLLDLKF